jgi:Flp pilus assembly CpaF family ATPase
MTEDSSGDHPLWDDETRLRPDADRGREPELISGRLGTRLYSMAALLERIVTAFNEEHADDSTALREAVTRGQRLHLILETTDYVLAVESVLLGQDEKADLIRRAYGELFGYGPLEALFADESITTIALDGENHVAVRHRHSELTELPPLFDSRDHLRRILGRLLRDAGTELRDDQPIVETGLIIDGRPVALNLMLPPISIRSTVDMRLHPRQPVMLDDLVAGGMMSGATARLLWALTHSPYGVIVVGDAESGKTTLLNALAHVLPMGQKIVSVERAGELRLPPDSEQFVVRWAAGDDTGATFGDQVEAALTRSADVLLLDEVRADAPLTIAPLLYSAAAPRQIWTFRGVPDAKRLQASLGMLARRANIMLGEDLVYALYDRLPFVVTVARIQERLQIFSVAEWQPNPTSDYPDYVMLMQYRDGEARSTGKRPVRPLDLPDTFWQEQ